MWLVFIFEIRVKLKTIKIIYIEFFFFFASYIYREFNWIYTLPFFFSPNNTLAIKIKKINRHVVENWTPLEIQFKI